MFVLDLLLFIDRKNNVSFGNQNIKAIKKMKCSILFYFQEQVVFIRASDEKCQSLIHIQGTKMTLIPVIDFMDGAEVAVYCATVESRIMFYCVLSDKESDRSKKSNHFRFSCPDFPQYKMGISSLISCTTRASKFEHVSVVV